MKPLFSRADLLRIAVAAGDDALRVIAKAHGFEREDRLPERPPEPPPEPPQPNRPPPPQAATALLPTPLWQPRTITLHGVDEAQQRAIDAHRAADEATRAEAWRPSDAPAPPHPPLSPWRRLGPLLAGTLTIDRPGPRLDLVRLVRRLAEGRQLTRLPRVHRRRWVPIEVIVDRPLRLAPFWTDQAIVVRELQRLLGKPAVALRVLDNAPGSTHTPSSRRRRPSRGAPILALSDLGHYAGANEHTAWLRLARQLQAAGQRFAALVPVPRPLWSPALTRAWRAIPWERPAPNGDATTSRAARVDRLLVHLAPAMRIERGLIRMIRRILPLAEADVGVEVDLWKDRVLGDMFPEYRVIDPSKVASLRKRFETEVSAADQARVIEALRRWHWIRERQPEAWHLEALTLEATLGASTARELGITASESKRAEDFMRWLVHDTRAAGHDEGEAETLRRWCSFIREHAPRALWNPNTDAGAALQTIAFRVGGVAVPNADPRLRDAVESEPPPEPREVPLVQVAWTLAATEDTHPSARSPLATIVLARPRITLASEAIPEETLDLSLRGARVPIPTRGRVELRTDRSTVVLEPFTRPTWARAIGRDRFGLWAELTRHKNDPGVAYRMRWIPPGRFIMGSPDDEPGRYKYEGPLHPVVITCGFWLGETPVTQALWQAVTGENPSYFKTPDRPVEQVSWLECQEAFIARLNERIAAERGEIFRLPTEAEWEYACRAGTTTATYAGPIEIRGENDAPVLDAIAWYGGNSGVDYDLAKGEYSSDWPNKQHPHTKAGTRRVAQKPPNPWGLHDTLGNVWEWCSDWFDSDYYSSHARSRTGSGASSSVARDPSGPATGGSRVIRGGSWYDGARLVRAASRLAFDPGNRYDVLGLRLARGQVRQDPAGPEGPADPEGR